MDRKEQILEVATKLVQTRGYSAFSCQDLSARLGITKASIHHHFPSKEDLGIAVAEKYRADVEAALAEAKRTSDDPHVQLDGYLQVVLEIIKTEDRICAVGSVQSDSNVVPATMGTSMCSLAPHVIGWIADVITAGQKRGVMDFPGTPAHHAAPIFSAAPTGNRRRARLWNRSRRFWNLGSNFLFGNSIYLLVDSVSCSEDTALREG